MFADIADVSQMADFADHIGVFERNYRNCAYLSVIQAGQSLPASKNPKTGGEAQSTFHTYDGAPPAHPLSILFTRSDAFAENFWKEPPDSVFLQNLGKGRGLSSCRKNVQ